MMIALKWYWPAFGWHVHFHWAGCFTWKYVYIWFQNLRNSNFNAFVLIKFQLLIQSEDAVSPLLTHSRLNRDAIIHRNHVFDKLVFFIGGQWDHTICDKTYQYTKAIYITDDRMWRFHHVRHTTTTPPTTLGMADISDLMTIIRLVTNISCQSPKLEWTISTHAGTYITKKVNREVKTTLDTCVIVLYTVKPII